MGARSRGPIVKKTAFLIWSCFAMPLVASGQSLQGRFFTPKSTYLVGEPIFLTYELANTSSKPVYISSRVGNPCFERSPITVEDASPARREWTTALDCGPVGYGGSCLSSEIEIKPNQSHSGRIFVNHYYQLDQPGIYEIRTDWNIPIAGRPIPSAPAGTVELMGDVDIRVVQGTEQELESAFQPILRDLSSADLERRRQDVQAITDLAQPFFEQTILDLSKNAGDVWAAIKGLYKLNTERSRDWLAELAEHSESDMIRERAMRALAALGDEHYLPLFFRLARTLKGFEQVVAIESTGLLGRGKAVPFLISFLRSSDPLVRGAAVRGLAGTANRNAIGPLIQETRDPGANVRHDASLALTQLTHRSVSHGPSSAGPNPGLTYQKWLNWWLAQGRTATIYGPTECAEPTPLN
jgi:HEAT repeats/PBS lyase HEAT-like repeat